MRVTTDACRYYWIVIAEELQLRFLSWGFPWSLSLPLCEFWDKQQTNSVAWARERTITTERPPLVCEVSAKFCEKRVSRGKLNGSPRLILGFLDRSRYFFFQVAPQLYSQGWVDPVPDPLLLRKSGSAGNRTRDLRICSQKLWPLDHRGRLYTIQATIVSYHNISDLLFHNATTYAPGEASLGNTRIHEMLHLILKY
jgi:hypothetical protein